MTWELAEGEAWALSLYQPYAWLVANGHKLLENRPWSTTFRGRFLVHAGKRPVTPRGGGANLSYLHAASLMRRFAPGVTLPSESDLDYGGIVGSAEVCGVIKPCLGQNDSDDKTCKCGAEWHFGRQHGLLLRNAKPLPFRSLRGMQRFFRVKET